MWVKIICVLVLTKGTYEKRNSSLRAIDLFTLKSIVNFLDRIWQNWKWLWSSEQLIDPVKQATWEKSVLSVPITVEHSTFPCYLWAWCTKFHTISIIMGWLFSGGVFIHISLIYMLKCHKNVLVIISYQTHL